MLQSQLNILYYGKTERLPERIPLQAGPLTLVYEAGDLRQICWGDREIIQRIYVAVRDQTWRTIPMQIANLQLERQSDSFRLTYEAHHQQDEIDFFWKAVMTGDRDGRIDFALDGVARSTFLRNRIGFCVLHPMATCRNLPCTVLKVDGTEVSGRFPDLIAPHQPFLNLAGISYEVAPQVMAELRFSGDVFEMEDQRNWTDASFKTYCTPIGLPKPTEVKAGTAIRQSISFAIQGAAEPSPVPPDTDAITVTIVPDQATPLPPLGLQVASHGRPLSQQEQHRLQALNLSYLRLDLHLSQLDAMDRLRQATQEARSLNLGLEIALLLSDNAIAELSQLAEHLPEIQPPVLAWLVFHQAEKSTSGRWVALARHHLANSYPDAKFGAGSITHFTELNRQPPPVSDLDQVCYAITPQVHAFDNTSLVENLATQAITVTSARVLSGDLPLVISPITLKPRPDPFNPPVTPAGQLPRQVDPRQLSLLGAGWTIGSLKYLLPAGVERLTYYETTGWLGVMMQDSGSPLPELFPAQAGMVFPLYHVLADVGEARQGQVLQTYSTQPLRVESLALRYGRQTCLLVANLTSESQTVTLPGLGETVQYRYLDERTAIAAMHNPEAFREQSEICHCAAGTLNLTLLPYATVRLTWAELYASHDPGN